MHNGDDSRLTSLMFQEALAPSLDIVERSWREGWRQARATKEKNSGCGALIIVGKRSQDKFFSNGTCCGTRVRSMRVINCSRPGVSNPGLDYENAIKDPHFHQNFMPRMY